MVVSFGVIEHFDDTASCLKAVSSFLKPGGILITNIPNMVGWIGAIQKSINKPVYDIHQLIDPAKLRKAHERAGLEVIECNYFIYTSFGVNNLTGISTNTISGFFKKIFLGVLSRVSMLVWSIENRVGYLLPRKFASPYVNCIARKP